MSSRAVSLCDRRVLTVTYIPGVPSHGTAFGDCQWLHNTSSRWLAGRRLGCVAVHCITMLRGPFHCGSASTTTIRPLEPGALSFSFFPLCLLLALNEPSEAGTSDHLHSLYTTEESHQSLLSLTVSADSSLC